MRTWEDFKKEIKEDEETVKLGVEEMEAIASIVNAIIEKRTEMGYSQRDLAKLCGIPHSSVARIEACTVKPNIETLMRIMKPLGLSLEVKRK